MQPAFDGIDWQGLRKPTLEAIEGNHPHEAKVGQNWTEEDGGEEREGTTQKVIPNNIYTNTTTPAHTERLLTDNILIISHEGG